MLLKKLQFILPLFVICFAICFGSNILLAKAQVECDDANVYLVFRNEDGEFIPDISFEIYEQTTDVDGNPKPGNKVASGKIDEITGRGLASFKPSANLYAIKAWHKNSKVGAFYFYNDIDVRCGETIEVTEYLSALKIILRNSQGELVRNQRFYIYTQKYDADNNPVKEKQDFVTYLDTSEVGYGIIYVADRDHAIDGKGTEYYVLEVPTKYKDSYIKYNIPVFDAQTTVVDYTLSGISLILKNARGVTFPSGVKIEIYKQDDEKDYKLGDYITNIYTDDNGKAIFEYPEGIYAARIEGSDKQYQIFWNLSIYNETIKEYILNTNIDWLPAAERCEEVSILNILVEDLDGNPLPNIHYELYEQNNTLDSLPKIGRRVAGGVTAENGYASVSFNPDPRKIYAIKLYDVNSSVGAFWYYNDTFFECGQNKTIVKQLPALKLVLRDADGNLKRNQRFSLYAQKRDADGQPIREKGDIISSSLNTSEEGMAVIYLSPYNIYDKQGGYYVFSSTGENRGEFVEYDIQIFENRNTELDYVFSDALLQFQDALENPLANKRVVFYRQIREADNLYKIGEKIMAAETDEEGKIRLEYPSGRYVAVIKDNANQEMFFWNVKIYNRRRTEKKLTTNLTRLIILDEHGKRRMDKPKIVIYSLEENEKGLFIRGKKLDIVRLNKEGYVDLVLNEGPYLFVWKEGMVEYGRPFYVLKGKFQKVVMEMNKSSDLTQKKEFYLTKPAPPPPSLADKLAGYIVLQVEERGEAWYIEPQTKERYYLKDGKQAYILMKKLGLGISNEDLKKIPIGLDARFEYKDTDQDGLPDRIENAINTKFDNPDSDGDGYLDGVEVENNYNPLGLNRLPINKKLVERLKGKILLQVEGHGEAWYLNPRDGKRYYLRDGYSAFQIMKYLSLGIKSNDLEKIEEGVF